MKPINVLVSLHQGYGLGDAVQMSAVLRHVAKYRPNWRVDYQAEEGRHCVGRGIVANTFASGRKYPTPHYNEEVQIILYDTWAGWRDCPNTRVSSCLHGQFGIDWDRECGRYRVDVGEESAEAARTLLSPRPSWTDADRSYNGIVAVHYEGDSSPTKKNLTHAQADEVCRAIRRMGRHPVILDWRGRSPLEFWKIRTPSAWGGDAEMVCAVISQCEAFVGIDSGPSKCASATETPSLVVWTAHHPAPFHDPASNTTHLVPRRYHDLGPVRGDPDVIEFFEANYTVRQYDVDPVGGIKSWLAEVLPR